jgi:hypothetical protein
MADRLWRTGESYVKALEERLARADLSEGAREGDARVFAIMVRAMRELMETGASAAPPQPIAAAKADAAEAEDHDPVPDDIEEFRRRLAEKLDRLVAADAAAQAEADAEARMREAAVQECDAFAFQRGKF